MLRPFALTATFIGALAAGPVLADGAGHSHAHSHPHQGHGTSGGSFHHTHEADTSGVVHTHEVNGVMVKHQHRKFESTTARLEYRERVTRTRFQVGAGFGPYSVAEYQARVSAGQPGLTRRQEPWPIGRYRNQD